MTMGNFCDRYITLAYMLRDGEQFAREPRTVYFRQRARAYVETLIDSEDPVILHAVAHFLWLDRDRRTWDVYLRVLVKKRDALTLCSLESSVGRCRIDLSKCDTLPEPPLITLTQAEALTVALRRIRTKIKDPGRCDKILTHMEAICVILRI